MPGVVRLIPKTAGSVTDLRRPRAAERVMVVADESTSRENLFRVLDRSWNVETYADGASALEAAKRSPPDIVVCDLVSPGLTGLDLLRMFRAEERTQPIPVILVYEDADSETIVRGYEALADDYVAKPFPPAQLAARVRAHLELLRLRIEGAAVRNATLYRRERAARDEAEAASRAKDEFLAMLSHELRNPLAPIVTALHVMELKGDESTQAERAVIRRQLTHVTRLVDDLLDVSRIMRGRIALELERVDLRRVVAKAVETASPLLEERRHRLEVIVPEGISVSGDAMRLSQVVSNLVTNAAKYTDPGGSIELTAMKEGSRAVLRVRDNGSGISRESLPTIFELFTQGTQSIERSKGGLGLGLAIVRNLVELHHGTVEARSDGPGKGSEFIVRLPLARRDESFGTHTGAYAIARPTRTPCRILIVDDNPDAARALSTGLALLGHTTRVAHDAPSGLDATKDFHPDIAFLDIGLPVMDGYELARRILATPGLAPRLVAITGYGQTTDREASHAAGFVEHLVKPVDLAVVAGLVERLGARQRSD